MSTLLVFVAGAVVGFIFTCVVFHAGVAQTNALRKRLEDCAVALQEKEDELARREESFKLTTMRLLHKVKPVGRTQH